MGRAVDDRLDINRLVELSRADFIHLDVGHWSDTRSSTEVPPGSLPYERLNEYAFERLCFHLLLRRDGMSPRFWGRRGQAQQGIDLIVSDGTASLVHQCKHVTAFDHHALEAAIRKFQNDWLTRPALGRPRSFVLWTSARLTYTTAWEETKRRLVDEIGVGIEERHRDTLDMWLRDEPGIVGDLFGDAIASNYCGRERDWDLGLFRPLQRNSGDRQIDRYLELFDQDGIASLPADSEAFEHILSQGQTVLLSGLAGVGKSMTALDLARGFEGGTWRTFYVRADDTQSVDYLYAGLRDRAFRPSIFVIDDCHRAFDKVDALRRRLAGLDRPYKLVLAARSPPNGMDFLVPDEGGLVQELREAEQILEIAADKVRFRAVVAKRKPSWHDPPIADLMVLSGQDLAILEVILDAAEHKDIVRSKQCEDLFPKILKVLFGERTRAEAPNLRRLAAVAQFDVAVPECLFPGPFEADCNRNAAARFVVAGGRPSALSFSHSSAAELVFRLLAWSHGQQDVLFACAQDCAEVLTRHVEQFGRDATLKLMLEPMVHARLNLSDDTGIKRSLLTNPQIIALIAGPATSPHPMLLSLAAFLCRGVEPAPPYASRLTAWLEARFADLDNAEGIGSIGAFLRSLSIADPQAHLALERRVGAAAMGQLIASHGNLTDLLQLLRFSTHSFAAEMLTMVTCDTLQTLTARSMEAEKSVGTMHLSLRELAGRPLAGAPDRTQLHLFEDMIGAATMGLLITHRGHLPDLLQVLRHSTDRFAVELLTSLTADNLETLIARTIEAAKSIGTLHFALRELSDRTLPDEPDRTQLHLFEERIDAAAMGRLITQSGLLRDLLRVLQYSTDGFAVDLLTALTPDTLETLVDRTIEAEKSITTLDLALRKLRGRPLLDEPDRTQLHLFEERLGAVAMGRLVARRGSLVDLLGLLKQSTDGFAAELLSALTPETLETLVARTVEAERSIGTLDLAMRELGRRPLPGRRGRTQLHLFEERFGVTAMSRLIAQRANLPELLRLLRRSTPDYSAQILKALEGDTIERLVTRTVEQQASIGTLNLALHTLGVRYLRGETGRSQLHLFEKQLGATAFWRLVTGAGNLNHLVYLLEALTQPFRASLFTSEDAPDGGGWAALLERGSLYDPARFAAEAFPLLPPDVAEQVRTAAEQMVGRLAARSTWGDIGSALDKTEKVGDQRVCQAVLNAATERITATSVENLLVGDFDAVSGALLLGAWRPELRPDLGAAIWHILPHEEEWPRVSRLLINARFALQFACWPEVTDEDALRVLRALAPFERDVTIEPIAARHHALFLWQLWGLWLARGQSVATRFSDLQSEHTWKRFVNVVKRRTSWYRQQDKMNTLMLAGALAFLVPSLRQDLVECMPGSIFRINHLIEQVDDDFTFVPTFFVLHGMALNSGLDVIFTPRRVARLHQKALAYEQQGPAIAHLKDWLLSHSLNQLSERWGGPVQSMKRGGRRH